MYQRLCFNLVHGSKHHPLHRTLSRTLNGKHHHGTYLLGGTAGTMWLNSDTTSDEENPSITVVCHFKSQRRSLNTSTWPHPTNAEGSSINTRKFGVPVIHPKLLV